MYDPSFKYNTSQTFERLNNLTDRFGHNKLGVGTLFHNFNDNTYLKIIKIYDPACENPAENQLQFYINSSYIK